MKIENNGYLFFKEENHDLEKICDTCHTKLLLSYRDIALKYYNYRNCYLPIAKCPVCFEETYIDIEYPYIFFLKTLKRKRKWLRWFFKDKKWLSLNKIGFKIYDLLFSLGFSF